MKRLFIVLASAVFVVVVQGGEKRQYEAVRIGGALLPKGTRVDLFRQRPRPAVNPAIVLTMPEPPIWPGDFVYYGVVGKKVVWAEYEKDPEPPLKRTWAVDVTWDRVERRAIVAVARSNGASLRVRLYAVSGEPIAAAPPKFEGLKPKTWPERSIPFAEFEDTLAVTRATHISLIPSKSSILVMVESSEGVSPRFLRFDRREGWEWVELKKTSER